MYERYQEMFGQVEADFAVNASFSHEHHPISMHLLQQGWNVLSEKPAATSRKDFDEMVAQRKSDKLYLVFQQYRFSPAFIKIQEMIASGKVGSWCRYRPASKASIDGGTGKPCTPLAPAAC